MIRYLKTVEEYERALQDAGRKLVVINFSSQKCGQCGIVAPQFENLCTEYPDVVLYKVLDDAPNLCQHCDIHSTPTFIFYKAQKKVERFSAVDMLQVKRTIEKLL
ncbi:thioredoxin-like [Xenopus laevis]|uniref:Thioredoxin-like n=1 Tax=Xenopus laevis TaxID=8355 RepID=A0A8J1KT49_XENLA|nr:thioredoxin-like [Xenopus laevis]